MKYSTILGVLCLASMVTILSGCGTAQPPAAAPVADRAQDEAAIRAVMQDWGRAIEEKNLEQTLSYYADDAWVFPQNAPVAKTADQRRSVWAAFFAMPGASDMEGNIERVEVSRSGDLATAYGTFAMSMNDAKGKLMTEQEKSVVTLKKQADGKWKVIADIWNTDK
jgi:uncharacterized protein (TIGR02246 family)